METEPIINGLQVSGIGMGMTSVVLIILALSVRGMAWIDAYMRRREAAQSATVDHAPVLSEESVTELAEQPQTDGAERAAAIAVAISLAQRANSTAQTSQSADQQARANSTYDAWLTEGRARQRAGRGVAQTSKGWR